LAVSSAAKVKEFHQEVTTPEQREEVRKLMKAMAPITYKVRKTEISKDGNKASLFVDATALDFFSMSDPKAKPQRENVEVRLVKEGDQWKVDKQCSGPDGCGKEPAWAVLSWGKTVALPDGSFKTVKGKFDFPGVKVAGKPFVADLVFNFPETGSILFYFLHRSPNLADIYVKVGEEKFAPVAYAEDFPPTFADDKGGREVKVLEQDYSYSRNRNFKGGGTVSLLFDLPKEAKGTPTFYLQFKYAEKEYAFEVK
jgi:hypothetical protein